MFVTCASRSLQMNCVHYRLSKCCYHLVTISPSSVVTSTMKYSAAWISSLSLKCSRDINLIRILHHDCVKAYRSHDTSQASGICPQKSDLEESSIDTVPCGVFFNAVTEEDRSGECLSDTTCPNKLNSFRCRSDHSSVLSVGDIGKMQRNDRTSVTMASNAYLRCQSLTKCSMKDLLLNRTVWCKSNHKRMFSSMNSSTNHYCLYNQVFRQTRWKRFLRHSIWNGHNCFVQKRTNYMGRWDGPPYRKQPPWRVLFFGTDFIALDTLRALHENMRDWSPLVDSLDVVTVKAQKPVRQYAEKEGLPLFDWPIKTDNSRYDVGILVSFGHMIPDRVIHMFPYGILNMHPSLLPRWRGASPIIHSVLAGDEEMGVSITEIRPKHFDVGPILMQREYPMPYRPTSLQLAEFLGKHGASMVLETLNDLPTLERMEYEQERRGVTYAHKISKKNGYIDCITALQRRWIVPIRTQWKDHIVSLHEVIDPAALTDAKQYLHPRYKGDLETDLPGTPVWHTKLDCIVIKCKEGLVGFKELRIKRILSARDFHNGYLNAWDGTRFTSVHNELNRYVKYEKMPITAST